ncbi:MAG: glutamate synthase [Planctomycetes bacterium]|nr:glutamate synthase [Planctomycetota bacterium]
MAADAYERLREARGRLLRESDLALRQSGKTEAEGGCGVVGLASTTPIEGRHLLASLCQMKNRGNGKGGGVAMVGLSAREFGVSERVLADDYLLAVAILEPRVATEVEKNHVEGLFDVDHVKTFRPGRGATGRTDLPVPPPDVHAYFVRPRATAVAAFAERAGLTSLSPAALADEFVYQNSFRLNRAYYASLGEKRAFVLSQGRNLLILKLVGYGDQVLTAYGLEDMTAHVWIGHHRYPTKGRVWHPGGAHPFAGLHEALVHNGDFANYHSITKYLQQQHLVPLFLTDTEVSVLLFEYLRRTCGYSLERVFESLAPTTERDFEQLPAERRALYKRLQLAHLHGSPDGPWFFILAANPRREAGEATGFELIGITDTSMLRPQVFALQAGSCELGLIASEKQGIDAVLRSLHRDGRIDAPEADLYWNARGGSSTDGGAFVFTVRPVAEGGKGAGGGNGRYELVCTNKFGERVSIPGGGAAGTPEARVAETALAERVRSCEARGKGSAEGVAKSIAELTRILDSRRGTPGGRRSVVRLRAEEALERTFRSFPRLDAGLAPYRRIDYASRAAVGAASPGGTLVVDARDFPPEGDDSLARFFVEARARGFREVLCHGLLGQRFLGCGLGAGSQGFTLHLYGNSGDYLASGLDGATVVVHGSAQDQLGNILKCGRLVVHGDVGQCFLYGAKGGEVYILGNAAGRPLINAVGAPRVVLNGTALDYLAESFMAGDPLSGGGFAVVNGIELDPDGEVRPLPTPYPGGNLFSLASGGALYFRDPRKQLSEDQLNGGAFAAFTAADWDLIRPYLDENERLFEIRVEELLTVDGRRLSPAEVYRKIAPARRKRH